MSTDGEDRRAFNRVSAGRAVTAETWHGSLYDEVAFLQRYGSAAELEERHRQACQLLEWWALNGPSVSPRDADAVGALELARERLHWLWVTADTVERNLRDRGYEFDPGKRVVRKVRGEDQRGQSTQSLVAEWVARTFELMTRPANVAGQEGGSGVVDDEDNPFARLGPPLTRAPAAWPRKNSKEIRNAIRSRLADKFAPELLTDSKIENALNTHLHKGNKKRAAELPPGVRTAVDRILDERGEDVTAWRVSYAERTSWGFRVEICRGSDRWAFSVLPGRTGDVEFEAWDVTSG